MFVPSFFWSWLSVCWLCPLKFHSIYWFQKPSNWSPTFSFEDTYKNSSNSNFRNFSLNSIIKNKSWNRSKKHWLKQLKISRSLHVHLCSGVWFDHLLIPFLSTRKQNHIFKKLIYQLFVYKTFWEKKLLPHFINEIRF